MQDLNITIIQSEIQWENPQQNLINFQNKLANISENPDVIILPEMFNTGFTMNVSKYAEKQDGFTVDWLKKQARKKSCVICGSVLIEEDKKFYNRIYWVHPEGTFETYDKRHLFRMANEHLTMSQGIKRKIVELKGWKINLQICYDLRFPVWSKNNYANEIYEYDAIIYVANWPEVRNYAYKSLLTARAIENQAYVIWVNRIGKDRNNINHSGDSMVVKPNGKTLIQAQNNKEEILETKVSFKELNEYRSKFRVGLDWDKYDIQT